MHTSRRMFTKYILSLLFILFSFATFSSWVCAQNEIEKKILILHSYQHGLPWTENIENGIESVLSEQVSSYEIYYEFLDAKRKSDTAHFENLFNLLKYKYHDKHVDVIISTDDHAFRFLLHNHQILFPETPIVFCGVNYLQNYSISRRDLITGVVEATDFEDTIRTALDLHPKVKEIYVIVDKTASGSANKEKIQLIESQFKKRVSFRYLVDYNMTDLQKKLHGLPQNSIAILLTFTLDKSGNTFTHESSTELISKSCNVPLYCFWDVNLGHGIVGGKLTSGFSQGTEAAKLAAKILQGMNAGEIKIIDKSPNKYKFDKIQLKRWGIDSHSLPEGSVIINKTVSFYERYKFRFWAIIGIVIFLVTIIFVLSWNILQRKRTEEELRISEQKFRTLAENVPGLVLKYKLNPDGSDELIYISKSVEDIFEVSQKEASNNNKLLWDRIHEDDLEEYIESIKTSAENLSLWEQEYRLQMSGDRIKWLYTRGVPLQQDDSSIVWDTIALDITKQKKAEDDLRRSEEKYRLIAENMADIVTTMDMDLNFTYISPSIEKLRGFSVEEALEQRIDQIMTPESFQCLSDAVAEELGLEQTGTADPDRARVIELEEYKKDGATIWVENTASFIRDYDQKPVGIIVVSRDITDRKQAENDLAKANRGLRVLKEAGKALLRAKDEGSLIEDICRIIVEIGGYSMGWVGYAEESPERFVKPIGSWGVSSNYLDNITITWDESATGQGPTGKAIRTKTSQFSTNITSDADYEPWRKAALEKGFESSIAIPICYGHDCLGALNIYSPEPDAFDESEVNLLLQLSNELAYGIISLRNKQAQNKAEEALRESEEKYRLLVEKANEGIFIAQDEVIKFPNPKTIEITGYTKEELATIPFVDLIHPEDSQMVVGRYRERLDGENPPSDYAFRIINKAGSELWLQINSSPTKWEGRPATINLIRDITEKRELEEQVRQARKMESIGTLAGGIAHEFNNMLGIIIGNTELALDDIPEWNPAADWIQEVRTASLRAKDVVQKLLSVARKTPESRKPIQILRIIDESLGLLRKTIPASIEIRSNFSCTTETVLADPTEISQVLMNLCTNSAHAMVDGKGVLEVTLESKTLDPRSFDRFENIGPGDYVKLTVSDNGKGIEPDILDRIFDPYFTTKDVDEGIGMGLAVVHGIVKKHEGHIRVESDVGKGTTVEVLFPLITEQPEPDGEETETLSTGTERILVIDDEASLVKMITQMLTRSGYEVVGNTSSVHALKVFKDNPEGFDLVITDMTMPEMTGDEIARQINQIRPDIPIILCTGHSDHMDENRAIGSGIKAFTKKPLGKADLTKTVRKVLDDAKV